MVRDVNHPSIIAWDNGNEGGWNTTVDNNSAGSTNVYAIWDPQNRHVQRPSSTFNNMQDDHYPSYSGFTGHIRRRFDTPRLRRKFCTDFLTAAAERVCRIIGTHAQRPQRHRHVHCGRCWMKAWCAMILGGNPIDVQDLNAPDGVVGPYRQREASYYTYKAIYNPAQVTAPSPAAFTGTLAVENRFSFTSLNQCTFDWQLGSFPDLNDPRQHHHPAPIALIGGFLMALDSGNFAGPNVAAGATGSLVLPGFPVNGHELRRAPADRDRSLRQQSLHLDVAAAHPITNSRPNCRRGFLECARHFRRRERHGNCRDQRPAHFPFQQINRRNQQPHRFQSIRLL